MEHFIKQAHPEWYGLLENALSAMEQDYLKILLNDDEWLPGPDRIFAAFSLPLSSTKYILLGESPYPRQESANGFAFWDNSVIDLWSATGLSKKVNKATSLRHIMKMLLYAQGDLNVDFSQEAIVKINKKNYIQTVPQFFQTLMKKGFLLLNASLVYHEGRVRFDAKQWQPFLTALFQQLVQVKPHLKLILFGKLAQHISNSPLEIGLLAEHPYNISFVTNPEVVAFFKPFNLLTVENQNV